MKQSKRKLWIPLLCLILAAFLCACSIEINIGTSEKDSSTNSAEIQEDESLELVKQEKFTNALGGVIAPEAQGVRISKALNEYKKAAQAIKDDAVGFTKKHWQDFNDIDVGGEAGIANLVLTIVSKNTVSSNTPEDAARNPMVISKGDAASVRAEFPLFDYDSVYVESETNDYISGAEVLRTDAYDEYYIYFADTLNPAIGQPGLGGLMTPFDREEILSGIRNYGFRVKQDTLKLDCNYSGCYMVFRIDSDDRLIYLEQNLFATIDAKAEIDLYVQSTNFMNGTCRYEEHYVYDQFNY